MGRSWHIPEDQLDEAGCKLNPFYHFEKKGSVSASETEVTLASLPAKDPALTADVLANPDPDRDTTPDKDKDAMPPPATGPEDIAGEVEIITTIEGDPLCLSQVF